MPGSNLWRSAEHRPGANTLPDLSREFAQMYNTWWILCIDNSLILSGIIIFYN